MNIEMLCRLCAIKTNEYFPIFEEIGRKLRIAEIITQHFWFQITKPSNGDHLQIVCKVCWSKISDFHRFYTDIEKVHGRLIFGNIKVELKSDENNFESCWTEFKETDEHIDESVVKPINILDTVNIKRKRTNVRKKKIARRWISKEKKRIDVERNELYRTFFNMDCDLCTEKFLNFEDVKKHYDSVHNQTGYVKCCSRKYFSLRGMKEHMNRHTQPKIFICDFCQKGFTRKASLLEHLLNHIRPSTEDKSGTVQLSKYLVRKEKTFQCDVCNKKYYIESLLLNHKSQHQCVKESYICDICGKIFVKYNSYNDHKRLAHDKPLPPVQCDVCKSWFTNRHNLRKHRIIHTDGKQTCEYCSKVLKNRRTLRRHCMEVHIEPKIFPCNVCGKEYRRKIHLQEHMSSHTGAALYVCTFCTKTFNSSANMYKHRKTAHPTEYQMSKEAPSSIGIRKSASLYALNKDL